MDNPEALADLVAFGARRSILALDRALITVPQTARERSIRTQIISKSLQALGAIGVDGENLIRYGMAPRAAFGVYLSMISPNEGSSAIQDLQRWREVLGVVTPSTTFTDLDEPEAERISESLWRVPSLLTRWVTHARFGDILGFRAPTDEAWSRYGLEPLPSEDVTNAYTWLWERSTVDRLDRWRTSSLHLEYLWQNAKQVNIFREVALRDEGPQAALLNAEIARRAVQPTPTEDIDHLFWDLQETAVDFLNKGKYAEAVALFEFHHRRNPQDARSMNNLGFCSMPINPSKALHWLREAAFSGYDDVSINTYNQCCCLERLNRADEALEKAENYWQRERPSHSYPGYLWVGTDPDWTLNAHVYPEVALAELGVRIATRLGRTDRIPKWEERLLDARDNTVPDHETPA